MTKPMRLRATEANGITTVRVLVFHDMEPGTRRDPSGQLIPAHFITALEATHQGKVILQADWSGSVSKDPPLAFKFKGAAKGDRITVRWTDNKGESRSDEVVVA